MSKTKSKKSTFFWICVIFTILAIIFLIVYLILCSYGELYHHYHKFKPIKSHYDTYIDTKGKLYNNLPYYRLGDMIRCKYQRGKTPYTSLYTSLSSKEYHLKNFPNTIASEYMRRTDDESNYEILNNIILNTKLKNSSLYIQQNSCLVHLRVGDVIDDSEFTVSQLLEKPRKYSFFKKKKKAKHNYVKSRSYYLENIEKLKDLDVKDVTIIAGSHIDINLTKSWKYITEIEKLFKSNDFNVMLYTGNHPDDDLILSSRVKYFVKSGGGYSIILSDINRLNGGTTL